MGSFAELVMSFPLRRDVSDEVLAAFSSIAVPDVDAPTLPPPAPEDWNRELDMRECDMTDPWSFDWGLWLGLEGTVSYICSEPRATMRWCGDQWVVTSRATRKAHPEDFIDNLAVLGWIIDSRARRYDPDVQAGGLMTGFFVGYTRHEYDPRPWLLWAADGVLRGENLNPPDYVGP